MIDERGYQVVDHERPFRYQEGEYTVTRGSAWTGPGCHEGCGVLLYTDNDGKLVKVEGDEEDPFNQGRLCARCLALPDVVYSDKRLLYPMKRDRDKRGKDEWERISWDEALDIIESKMGEICEKYGPETVLFEQGTGRDIATYISRLCWSYGSPNYVFTMSGEACWVPRIAGMSCSAGNFLVGDYSQEYIDRYDNPNWRRPELIILWGNNPIISSSDGLYGPWVIDCMKMGTKLLTVDPRRTWLANHSDMFLQVRPGTDAALAMGMLNVIISEDIYDHDFVSKWCYGFEELAEHVKEWTPEKTEEVTLVPAGKMIAAARLIAEAKPSILQWGLAIDTTREAMPAGQAVTALSFITGNVDNPGGMIIPPSILKYEQGWGSELISEEVRAKKIVGDYALLKGMPYSQTDEVLKTLETGEPYKLHGAWIQTTNFLTCTGADPKRQYEAYKNLDFIVGVDLFMTPTLMALADVVLPAQTYAERDGLATTCGVQHVSAINKVCQVGEAKSDMEIILEVGKRFNPEAWPWDNVEDMFSEIIRSSGRTFKELQEQSPVYMPHQYYKYEKGLLRADGQVGFETPTGRIELWSNAFAMTGQPPLPEFSEPEPGPVSTPELYKEYPFMLTTGSRVKTLFHSEHRQIPRMRAYRPDPIVEVHPKAAKEYGLEEGDWVWLEGPAGGKAKRKVHVTPIVLNEHHLSCDHGWWFPEGNPEDLYGIKDLNINQLVEAIPGKSGFGANYKTLICKMYKVEEG